MQKDWKIGIVLGLALVASAVLWLSTRPSLSTKARMLRSDSTVPLQETVPASHVPNKSRVTAISRAARSHEPRETRFHIVRKGETLSGISFRYYGSANKWQKILSANRDSIKDANKLSPGTKLIIPE